MFVWKIICRTLHKRGKNDASYHVRIYWRLAKSNKFQMKTKVIINVRKCHETTSNLCMHYSDHIWYAWEGKLTASVQPNRRLTKDFHWKNASSDWPICTIAKYQNGFKKTNKYRTKLCFLYHTKKAINANCSSPRSKSSEPP